MNDEKARDRAEKLIRLSQSNHENEANLAARNACKVILENKLSLYEQQATKPTPARTVVERIRIRVPEYVPDPTSYQRGYQVGKTDGYTEAKQEAQRALPPVVEKKREPVRVILPSYLRESKRSKIDKVLFK
jgi:hypothetical protein